jgi:hypothetical protein
MGQVLPILLHQFFSGIAKYFIELIVCFHQPPCRIFNSHTYQTQPEILSEALFALPEGFFRLFAAGTVTANPNCANQFAMLVDNRSLCDFGKEDCTVLSIEHEFPGAVLSFNKLIHDQVGFIFRCLRDDNFTNIATQDLRFLPSISFRGRLIPVDNSSICISGNN